MDTLITNGIRISVEPFYQSQYSKPVEMQYIFAYRITIENLTDETVQLMRRHWVITDSTGVRREVNGEGVVGQQPVLAPGQQHQYVSWCHLTTGLGTMSGSYQMVGHMTHRQFEVDIPEFRMEALPILN